MFRHDDCPKTKSILIDHTTTNPCGSAILELLCKKEW